MKRSANKIQFNGIDNLFSTEKSRLKDVKENVMAVLLSELHSFENHPYKVWDDKEIEDLAESTKERGTDVGTGSATPWGWV